MSSPRAGPELSEEDAGASTGKTPMVNGSTDCLLTPELLYKMNKKIAQLTKVVYGLNTRGEELECQLGAAKEAEEKTRTLNSDLQHRVNNFKSKIESEMGKLRELENQANQAQIWKIECENLQRRLDAMEASKSSGDSYAALIKAREEIEQFKRRENSLQYETDQARHAITNLKAHHDFIMRERDAQQAMENEKIVLEWQTRHAEMEARYKSQIRRISDDLEVLSTECEIMKARQKEESLLRDQLLALQLQYDSDRREWEMKFRRHNEDFEEERTKHNEEKRELMRKLQLKKGESNIEERAASFEDRIKELSQKNELMQRLLVDKEEEFELRLKTKVVEWKSEWEMARVELQNELKSLRDENGLLISELNTVRQSAESEGPTQMSHIQQLETQLANMKEEIGLKTRNFEVRANSKENENTRLRQENFELKLKLEEDREKSGMRVKSHETCEKTKDDLLKRLRTLKDTENILKEANRLVEEENGMLKKEKEELNSRLKIQEEEWREKLKNEIKNAESRVRQNTEKIWLDRLQKSDETSSYDLEKVQEANRRREEALKRELSVGRHLEHDAKQHSEELIQKVRILRQSEAEKIKALREVERDLDSLRMKDASSARKEKELLAQEQKYRQQVDELSRKLAEKQQEVSDLVEELEEAKDATQRKTSSTEQYEIKIEELKRQIREEEAKTESVRVELHFTKNESEITKAKMRRLEEELSKSKELSNSLQDDNEARGRDVTRLKELEVKVKSLEDSLRKTECSRKDMEESLAEVEAERDEELKIVQDALDEAAQEREELILTFQKELDQLNTNNTAREQQMLEDFEWKIHEMEKEHKQRIGEKERHAEERFQTIRSLVETELADSITKIAEDRRVADDTLAEVGHLKSYEAEVIQLRGVTHEFQKALRASAREMENMRIRERILDDEIRTLKKSAQSRQNTLQRVKRQADEEEIRQRLEKMKNEINALWEDRMRSECSRLKTELDELHSEEKHLAVESMKVQKEQEIQMLKKSFDLRQEEMANDISSLKDSLADKDAYYNKKLDTQRTMSERDLWDLRMKLQKLSESSFDQKQQLEEKYREDIERLRVDYEDRIKELESRLARYDAQIGVDVIAQMEKDHKLQMEHVGEQHQRSMERLREELEAEKFQAVEDARVIISKHHEEIESNLREQLAEVLKSNNQCRDELEAVRFSLSRREEAIRAMEDELEHYQNNKGDLYSSMTSRIPQAASTTSSGISSSQFSLASSNDSHGSRNSQDRYSIPDTGGGYDPQDDSQRNGGLLGKVFGGSWFTPSRSNTRRGSTPLLTKKPYT